MNPITCADVHFEDGTLVHMTWPQLRDYVGQQGFDEIRAKRRAALKPVCQIPDCGCNGDAHP